MKILLHSVVGSRRGFSGPWQHNSDDPETEFVVQMIVSAVQLVTSTARHTYARLDAAQWLVLCAPQWLAMVLPDGADIEMVHREVLDQAGVEVLQ